MRQRDCGCGGLVTPTLDQLLAVARGKPLPRVRVTERRPPPARVGASLKGWMEWRLINRQGREVRGGEGPNLILDQGLDEIAATTLVAEQGNVLGAFLFFPLIRYAAVGTDNTAPTTDQTGLGTEVARTDTTYSVDTITRPGNGLYLITRFIEFDYDEANGNLTEWGFSSSASAAANLFNRALFLDGGGSPDAITKTDEEKLRIAYTLEVSLSPVSLTSGSFAVTGVGTVNGDYMLVGGEAPSSASSGEMRCAASDVKLFSALARGVLGVATGVSDRPEVSSIRAHATDMSGVTYTDDLTYTSDSSGRVVAREIVARDAYTPGSFQRTGGSWRFDTGDGNLDPIRAFIVHGSSESFSGGVQTCSAGAYVFDLDLADEFSKDDEHALTIGAPTVTWGRGS